MIDTITLTVSAKADGLRNVQLPVKICLKTDFNGKIGNRKGPFFSSLFGLIFVTQQKCYLSKLISKNRRPTGGGGIRRTAACQNEISSRRRI